MQVAGLRYGLISNYRETIFLKQELDEHNKMTLFYLRVIYARSHFRDDPQAARPQITVKEATWYMMTLLTAGHLQHNTVPLNAWVN